jgi:hypothetical protein
MLVATAISATLWSRMATADDITAMAGRLGLIGIWSSRCASPDAFRMIVDGQPSVPLLHTSISFDGGIRTTVRSVVLGIRPLGPGQASLRLRITGGDRNGGPLPSPTTNTFDQVLETIGSDRLRIANTTPLVLERCGN